MTVSLYYLSSVVTNASFYQYVVLLRYSQNVILMSFPYIMYYMHMFIKPCMHCSFSHYYYCHSLFRWLNGVLVAIVNSIAQMQSDDYTHAHWQAFEWCTHNVSARVCYGIYVRRTSIWLSNETSLMHVSFNGCAETCTLIMRQPACQDTYLFHAH